LLTPFNYGARATLDDSLQSLYIFEAMRDAPLCRWGTGHAAHIRRFETVVRVAGETTGGSLALLEHRLPPGTLAMPRYRHGATEALSVTSGALCLELDGVVHLVNTGDVAVVQAGVPHTFWVSPDAVEPAFFVAVVTPAGLERYYADVSAAISASGMPQMDAIHAAGERHGVQVELGSLFDLIGRYTLQLS
jgi:quercetin dioxygenase-like cupin family protein